jgi:hypothetical protein
MQLVPRCGTKAASLCEQSAVQARVAYLCKKIPSRQVGEQMSRWEELSGGLREVSLFWVYYLASGMCNSETAINCDVTQITCFTSSSFQDFLPL